MAKSIKKHPIQPLQLDEHNVLRFKENKIVTYLLDKGGIDLNDIARQSFSREDREQFAQLIGYSHSGAHDLGYMSTEVLETAQILYEEDNSGRDERDVMIDLLQNKLKTLRNKLADVLHPLFEVHPDDLKE